VFKKKPLAAIKDLQLPNNTKTILQPQIVREITTIELHKNDISLCMVKDAYDVIDVLNCVEYKYYKNMHENFQLKAFSDIQNVFKLYNIDASPYFIEDVQGHITQEMTPVLVPKVSADLHIYFTYHKHVVEKKSDLQNSPADNWYDNWYVIMYKNKLQVDAQTDVQTDAQVDVQTDAQVDAQVDVTCVPITCSNKHQDVLEECSSPSITVKRLKEHLSTMGLKVSGKKDELLKRLLDHLNK